MFKNKLSILIFCLVYQISIIANPVIVLLIGSGSTGKTSIATAISKMSSDWHIVDEDQLLYKIEREAIQEIFPEEYETITKAINPNNVLSAIQNNVLLFEELADEECQEAAKLALQKITSFKKRYRYFTEDDIFQEINKGLEQGKNVIVDDWFLKVENVKANFPNIKVIEVFVYSSLLTCYNRFKRRNNNPSSNLDATRRTHGQLVCLYANLYKLTNQSDYQSFPEFKKTQIEELFEKISKKVKSSDDDLGDQINTVYGWELTVDQLNKCRDQLITDNVEEQPVFFEPRRQYDILLNYENTTPELAAMLLLQNISEL